LRFETGLHAQFYNLGHWIFASRDDGIQAITSHVQKPHFTQTILDNCQEWMTENVLVTNIKGRRPIIDITQNP
jgi:hypothetical protein